MYKNLFSISICLLCLSMAKSQTVTLEELQQKALQNYPLSQQKVWVKELGKTNQILLGYSEYPQTKIIGQATYQSEVTKFDFPGIPSPKAGNYNIGVDLHYAINDFDLLKTRKALDQQRTVLGMNQIDVEIQRLKERVTAVYGNILLQKENQEILNIRLKELETQLKRVASAVKNGMVLKNNQLVLEAEILSTQEKITDVEATVSGLLSELSLITGIEIKHNQHFVLPEPKTLIEKIERPELEALQSQHQLLALQDVQLKQENKPHLALFAQGFYGRPGYNFLKQDPRFFGISGIGLNWNINSAATQKTKLKATEIQQKILEQQESAIQLNFAAALLQKKAEIAKFSMILLKDKEIVSKRKEILQVVSSQLENGAITSTEYITELNAQNMAELNLQLHLVQEAMAKVQYNTLTGH